MAALRALYNRPLPSLPVPMSYEDLSPSDTTSLTRIFAYVPPPTLPADTSQRQVYNRTTSTRIAELPSHLRSHPSPIARAVNRLCRLHKELLPGLLGNILNWIKQEIGKKIPRVLVPLLEAGAMSEEQQRIFTILTAVPAMWLFAEDYAVQYNVPVLPKWERQENGCAACMLSRIGGEQEVLLALRAGMVARMRGRKAEGSKRLQWVEEWMKNCSGGGEELVRASDRLGSEIKEAWKKWRKEKKEKGRLIEGNDVGGEGESSWEARTFYDAEHGDDSEDFEDEIIRAYRNTMFGLSLPMDSAQADLEAEKSHNIRPFSESFSDTSDDFATEGNEGGLYHDADALAEEYCSLLDGSAFDSDEEDVSPRQQRRTKALQAGRGWTRAMQRLLVKGPQEGGLR